MKHILENQEGVRAKLKWEEWERINTGAIGVGHTCIIPRRANYGHCDLPNLAKDLASL